MGGQVTDKEMALKCMGRCLAQPVTPELQITRTKCHSPKTPEHVGARHSSCAPGDKAANNWHHKPLQYSDSSESFWRNNQKCKHRCMGTDANQSHLFLPRQHECLILGAVCGLKHRQGSFFKMRGYQAGGCLCL